MKLTKTIIALSAVTAVTWMGGCTRIETGHVGVRTAYNGVVEMTPLDVGFHQNIAGHIREVVANEITLELKDIHPQTKDRTKLSELDLTFTYSVDPSFIPQLLVKYKGRDLYHDSTILPAGAYITNVMQTAAVDVIGKYDALTANENRENIKVEIRDRAHAILEEEKLKGPVQIHQVFIKNLQIDKSLQESALAVIASQNALKAKDYEVQTAKKEAERISLLSQQSGPQYTNLLSAQATMKLAEAVAAGKVNTIVVPYDFKGIVNVK